MVARLGRCPTDGVDNPSRTSFCIAFLITSATLQHMRTGGEVQPHGRYRMIAIDLDGTLLSPTGHVTPRAKAAVHKALAAGLLVCFATGRNWTESKTILDAVEHYGTAVFVGGAVVVDTGKQLTLHRTMMQPQLARELCAFLKAEGHAACALQDTHSAGVDYLVS